MGLISKTVITNWHPKMKEYYVSKGYIFTKMGDKFEVNIEDLKQNSNVYVEVICDCEDCENKDVKLIKWQKYQRNTRRNGKYRCKKCSTLERIMNCTNTKLKNSISFEQWCYDNLDIDYANEILSRWDTEKNSCLPSEITYSSMGIDKKGYWFKCLKHPEHKGELKSISCFTSNIKTRGYSEAISCNKCNTLGYYLLDMFGENALDLYWSDKNIINPFEYAPKSKEFAWFKCPDGKHEDYIKSIGRANRLCFRCPNCSAERDESILQEKVRLYLESLGYTIFHEHNCTIVPKNPKTKQNLPFDNEVVELNLIIEVHGRQHYELFNKDSNWLNGSTPEETLRYQKLKDRYKKIYSYIKEYYYLEIPYWTDNKKEEWKKLINYKIETIINKKEG